MQRLIACFWLAGTVLFIKPLPALTLIDNFWELRGYAGAKMRLLLLDFDEGVDAYPEQIDASYDVSFDTFFYLGNLSLHAAASYYSVEDFSFDNASLSFVADFFDLSVGKQQTVWGFGSFFHPSYALELQDEETAELPSGAVLWSANINIPFSESQFNLFGYFEGESIEEGEDPTWAGASLVFQSGLDIFEFSLSGSTLIGDSINNKLNFSGETRIDLGEGYILTASSGHIINLESALRRYTPTGLLGVSFSSPDGKQQFTIEGYYDKSIFLASRLGLQLLAGFSGSVLVHLDMENRGIRLSSSLSYGINAYFGTSLTITYLSGNKNSRFYNYNAPLLFSLSSSISF